MNTGSEENMNTPRIPFMSCFRVVLSSSRWASRKTLPHTTNIFHVLFQGPAASSRQVSRKTLTHHQFLSCPVSETCFFIQTGISENMNTPRISIMSRFRDLLPHSDGPSRKTLTYRESLSCPVSETCFLIQTGITENINRHHESLSCPVSETCFLIQTGITENINTPRISIMSRFRDLLPHSDGHHGKH